MPAFARCAIRYRLDGPGPATFLVECDGEPRVYARGVLGGAMPRGHLLALLAERGCRWVPATGDVLLEDAAGDPAAFAIGPDAASAHTA